MLGERIGEILRRAGLVDDLQLRSAVARQAQWGGRIGKHVAEMGFAQEDAVADAIASGLSLQRVALGMLPHDSLALSKVALETAEDKGVFPYALRDNGKTLWLAMADPTDLSTVDDIAHRSGCRIRTSVAGEKEIVAAIWRGYRKQEPPAALVSDGALAARSNQPLELGDVPMYEEPPVAAPPPPQALTPTQPRQVPPWNLTGFTPPNGVRVDHLPDLAASLPHPAADEVQRLRVELEKTTRVLRGLIDLLIERRVLTGEELRAVISRLPPK